MQTITKILIKIKNSEHPDNFISWSQCWNNILLFPLKLERGTISKISISEVITQILNTVLLTGLFIREIHRICMSNITGITLDSKLT